MKRYLLSFVKSDLQEKMVFLSGPRQVGKTTLAKQIFSQEKAYYNWDIGEDRHKILHNEFPISQGVILDEIHKYKSWRNYLKGLYDKQKGKLQILVTGSAKLDVYKHGGDSLQGRYHHLRLHPLSVAELKLENHKQLLDLLSLGGFPEPYLSQNKIKAQRWSLEYKQRLVQDEIKSLEQIQDLGNLELMLGRLPLLVGSPLSINSLREDLQVNHATLSKWLVVAEKLYAIFRLLPFGPPKIRAVKKEQKHYHFDWSVIDDLSFKFENLVACHLLKWAHFLYDTQGREVELKYYRDVYKREVDFVLTEKQKPILFVEAKLSDAPINDGLKYLNKLYPQVESWQISLNGKKDYQSPEGIRVAPALQFLKQLV